MKNKQVKQMMKDVFYSNWFYRLGDFICAVPFAAGSKGMVLSDCFGVISITAMHHWLFLSSHKSEKESWQVTIK